MLCHASLRHDMLCYDMLCNAMLSYAMICNALRAVLSFAMDELLGGAMLCIAMLYYALHCIALRCMCMPSEERIPLIGVAPGSLLSTLNILSL